MVLYVILKEAKVKFLYIALAKASHMKDIPNLLFFVQHCIIKFAKFSGEMLNGIDNVKKIVICLSCIRYSSSPENCIIIMIVF